MRADEPAPAGARDADRATRTPRRGTEAAVVAATWLLGQLVFFRAQWLSGFDRVMGDPGAARFLIYVDEHWYQALLGHASWRNPGFYFPVGDTLGRSDTLLLWQVAYAPLRALGADEFLSYQLVLVALSAVGFATFYLLVRSLWHPPVLVGLVGATVFAFSNALYANANHAQLFGVLLVPAVGLLAVAAWRSAAARRRTGIAWGAAAGALGVLVLYSTYYVGYFAALGVVVACLMSFALAPRATAGRAAGALRVGWPTVLGVLAGAAGPAVLFVTTYLPAIRSAGGYGVESARYFAPRPSDLLNVGFGNLLWGSALVRPAVHGVAAVGERDFALTPLLLVVTVMIVAVATARERAAAPTQGGRRFAPVVLLVAGLVLLVLPLEVGGAFLWRAVAWLPGAQGIRAVDRTGVVASLALALALVAGATRLAPLVAVRRPLHRDAASPRRRVATVAALVVAGLVVLEQVNVSDTSQLSRPAQLAVLDAVPRPPSWCGSFFVTATSASSAHPARVQTTAMLLSERFSIPTLNGTSGSFPAGWHLSYPSRPGYLHDVAEWLARRHVTGTVCDLDLDARSWTASRGSGRP